jgi:hypothetical protein
MRMSAAAAIALAVALVAASGGAAAAEEELIDESVEKGSLGAGIIIGEPTGVCAKLYLEDDRAFQAAIGATFVSGGFQAHIDYVLHPWILEEREAFILPAYVGAGLRMMQHAAGRDGDSDFRIGPRAVAGLLFEFKEIPLDVFVEVAGIAEYRFGSDDPDINGFGLALNGGLGSRYYF